MIAVWLTTSPWMLLALMGALAVVAFLLGRLFGKGEEAPRRLDPLQDAAHSIDAATDRARAMLVLFEQRMETLQHLIKQADAAAEGLNRAVRNTESAATASPKATPAPIPDAPPPTSVTREQELATSETMDSFTPPPSLALEPNEPPSTDAATMSYDAEPPHAAKVGSALPEHERVHKLADQGHDSVRIARETGLQRGEVEVILGIRRTAETHSDRS